MASFKAFLLLVLSAFIILNADEALGEVSKSLQKKINKVNRDGPYLGLVIPNAYEQDPLLGHPEYEARRLIIDIAGRRFRFGRIGKKSVVSVMTGLGMVNAGVTTQLLLSFFNIEGVVHYGIAGNANPSLNIGDVAIAEYWAHLALWNWQRYGQGPRDLLPLEAAGDYTRDIGYLRFADFTTNVSTNSEPDNLLNNVWYQREEIFPVDGTPEERQHAFWIPASTTYLEIAKQLQGLKLESCVNSTTCLQHEPRVVTVEKGGSNNFYLDNAAYRSFIREKFEISPVDMESASVALISRQQRKPFIIIRALSDLAGGGSAESNEADTFLPIAATNSVRAVVEFIKLLPARNYLESAMRIMSS